MNYKDIDVFMGLCPKPHIAFSFGTKGAKEKALQKENAVLWGVAPNPIRFLKKAKPKTFKLGRQCRQPNSMFVILKLFLQTPTA